MGTKTSIILTEDKIFRILRRISTQIIENNHEVLRLFLVGINGQGFQMATLLKNQLQLIKPDLNCQLAELIIDKKDPVSSQIKLSIDLKELERETVILVDDVLHTGRTVRAALNELFDYGRPASVHLAVLVDRGGRELPIAAQVAGKTIDLPPHQHVQLSGPKPLMLEVITSN